jgi:hypothetical protein
MSNGFFIEGNGVQAEQAGSSVGGGGDVNGDGLDDLVISANTVGTRTASAYVVFGKSDGSTISISSLTASTNTGGFRIADAVQIGTYIDQSPRVQIIGDVNGDGLADVSVTQIDRTVVVFGKNDGSTVSASAIAAGTSSAGFVIQGVAADGRMGFLTHVGDMNGDGLDDMALNTEQGRSYIVFGQTGASAVQLSAPSLNKFVPISNEAGSVSQATITAAGDVNGDGFADLIIGVPTADPAAGVNTGKSYVIFGGFSDVTSSVFQISNGDAIGTTGNDTLTGDAGANQLVGADGNDTLIGNGGADVIYGGKGNDLIVLNESNIAMLAKNTGNVSQGIGRIDGGNGIDTIKLDGTSVVLDLTAIRNQAIDDIDRINLNGNGSAAKMGLLDVIHLASENNNFNTTNGWTVTSTGGAAGWG